MKQFLFVRHAESEANIGSVTDSPLSINLTSKGVEQAKQFADSFLDRPDLVITSSYVRTVQTAAPVINKYPDVPVKCLPLHEFTYLTPSLCQNTTAIDRLPMVNEYWQKCDPEYIHGAEAESFNQFIERVSRCIKSLCEIEKGHILIFTHGQVIRLLMHSLEVSLTLPDQMEHFRDVLLARQIPHLYKLSLSPRQLRKANMVMRIYTTQTTVNRVLQNLEDVVDTSHVILRDCPPRKREDKDGQS